MVGVKVDHQDNLGCRFNFFQIKFLNNLKKFCLTFYILL